MKVPLTRNEILMRDDEIEWVDIPQKLVDDLLLLMGGLGVAFDVLMTVAQELDRDDLSDRLADYLNLLSEALTRVEGSQ